MNLFFDCLLVVFLFFLNHCSSTDCRSLYPSVRESLNRSSDVSFITFGDWGYSNLDNTKMVAKAVHHWCTTDRDCDFVLTLGDNFYEFGVSSIQDPLWEKRFECIYDNLTLPFYASLGNHDTDGNEQAQIDYSQVNPLWHMDGEYYSEIFPIDDASPLLEVFIINSLNFGSEAQTWLSQALDRSVASWKILVFHAPLISNGPHLDDDDDIQSSLLPIICNRVDILFAGHEHLFSHLQETIDGCLIDQVILGTGGASLVTTFDESDSRVLSTGLFYGFGWAQANSTTLLLNVVDASNGEVVYTKEWTH